MSLDVLDLWREIRPEILAAVISTMALAAAALALGLGLGLIVVLIKLGRNRHLARLATVYIEVFRGTPALIQLFIIYFGLTSVGVTLSSYQAAVVGLGMNAAAYLAEIYRSGIEAVAIGQREAAAALGMTPWQTMRVIVIPQAIRIVLPSIGNLAIALLKDTSVASLIAAPDLMLRAKDLSSEYFQPMPIFIIVGAIYFCMCSLLSILFRLLERVLTP